MNESTPVHERHATPDAAFPAEEPTERCPPGQVVAMREAARAGATSEDARATCAGDAQVLESLRDLSRGAPAPAAEEAPVLLTRPVAAAPQSSSRAEDTQPMRAIREGRPRGPEAWLVLAIGAAVVVGGACGVLLAERFL